MNLPVAYLNPSFKDSNMPRNLLEGKITKKSPIIIWDYSDSPKKTFPITNSYSLTEIDETKQDFIVNFNNLHKYPKMTEKDWE